MSDYPPFPGPAPVTAGAAAGWVWTGMIAGLGAGVVVTLGGMAVVRALKRLRSR